MDMYDKFAQKEAKRLTNVYSTSFSLASRFFPKQLRVHIFNIYGMVRVADEIVDTYRGDSAEDELNAFESQTYHAIESKYSTNPILHAFQLTANQYKIPKTIIRPFFASMRMDLNKKTYTDEEYQEYIYGSAEVVGLMCLTVFTGGDTEDYSKLEPGAKSLGAAFQKVNFLRDFKQDTKTLGRVYFPDISPGNFNESDFQNIIEDIKKDFLEANAAIEQLPSKTRTPIRIAYCYYSKLLRKIERSGRESLQERRIRVNNFSKIAIIAKVILLNLIGYKWRVNR